MTNDNQAEAQACECALWVYTESLLERKRDQMFLDRRTINGPNGSSCRAKQPVQKRDFFMLCWGTVTP